MGLQSQLSLHMFKSTLAKFILAYLHLYEDFLYDSESNSVYPQTVHFFQKSSSGCCCK
jgi:hypothetical protein